jgi:hypothetical protein
MKVTLLLLCYHSLYVFPEFLFLFSSRFPLIASGCSKHMTGDKDKLLSISKRKTGNVILENDELGKIKDRGMVSLSNDKGDA